MSWNCWKCTTLCRLTGIIALSAIIAEDPRSKVCDEMISAVYRIMSSKYGKRLSKERFKENTYNMLGEMDDFAFMAAYPKKICEWFKRC